METAAVSAVPPYSGLRDLAEPLGESAARRSVTLWGGVVDLSRRASPNPGRPIQTA